jgi:hypothetical protein
MEGNFSDLIKASQIYKKDRDSRLQASSNERLLKIARKKIQTTMIGALSSIEKYFGFLWAHSESRDLTQEEEHAKELYEKMRSEILDRGNNQARNLEAELAQYEVKWLKYNIKLPVTNSVEITEGDENA